MKVFKARAVWLFGIVLACAGFAAALGFAILAWQNKLPALAVPAPAGLADRVNLGALLAVLGAGLAAAGVLATLRQAAVLRAVQQQREDAQRRVAQYRSEAGVQPGHEERREPYLGTGTDC